MFSWKGKDISDLDSGKLKRNIPAYVILALAVGAMTFFGVCEPSGNRLIGPSGVAASVDGMDVSALEFRRAHINRTQQAQQQFKDNFDPVKLGISQAVVNGLVDQLVYYKEAVRNGLYASDDEVANVIIEGQYFQNEQGKFDPELFQRYLRSQRHTEASFTEEIRRSLVNSKLRSFVTDTYRVSREAAKLDKLLTDTKINVEFVQVNPSNVNVNVSDEDIDAFLADGGEEKVRKYFDQNPREFNKEAQVKARHVLIAFQGASRATGDAAKRSKEDAKALAEKVLKEAKSGDFVAVVKKYTDEASGKTKGGDLGYFKKGDMVPEFSEAAFAMNKGEISNIVESKFGFHIIKVEDTKPAVNTSFDDAKRSIASKLVSKDKRPELAKAQAEKALEAAKSGNEAVFKELGLEWKTTGEFALNARFLPGGLGSDPKLKEAALSLEKAGDVADSVVEASGSHYILRLKSREGAEVEKMSSDELEQLADSSRFLEAFWMYNKLTQDVKKTYEDANRIYRNEEYMQYDAILRSQSGS
ncbi:peptidylprolyl isomerase [Pseudobacteriovorax antillogorgiicola]|uniref:Periplasmic chaperone PpiD n=1 Tax=Pseudobacteriovorax antillogorgiicola TaxID=1513793 RepID=A0A1Y6C2B9_9BACT|nr:SurA N-terminal domain-containing protein [Pseudobacteriovorax antillogorgiicola]TCS50188.1 peptidyl-prolyl cis-trans isomerase D [Pseudobacteriovorax antillogorgiicola]SMF32124.1 peptidyl-prolyl cis-trans isomerase D [Pseudobacteriovorax antillogorgiicola]